MRVFSSNSFKKGLIGLSALAAVLSVGSVISIPGAPGAYAQSVPTAPLSPTAPLPRTPIETHNVQNTAGVTETAALPSNAPEFVVPAPRWGDSVPDIAGAALREPLGDADAARYKEIFALQRDGKWRQADKIISALENRLLMGHVQFQRLMHPTDYRSKYKELKSWLDQYADHPEAKRIYSLAKKRRPRGASYPKKPRAALPSELVYKAGDQKKKVSDLPKRPKLSRARRNEIRAEQRRFRYWVQRGSVTRSLEELNSKRLKRLFDPVSRAESLGVIARGYFRYHKDSEAIEVARTAIEAAPGFAHRAAWYGGLAAFRADQFEVAANLFEKLAGMRIADTKDRSAGAYWASRSYMLAGQPWHVNKLLVQAAQEPRSFYGLLAFGALGISPGFDWEMAAYNRDQSDMLARIPAAERALGLIQAGNRTAAAAELKRITDALPPNLAGVLLTMADRAGLADLAYRVGYSLERRLGFRLDAAMYPTLGTVPKGGYKLDRALLFALIRQESRFRPNAKSRAGARGLMQLMPATAGFVEGRRFSGSARNELLEPSYNMAVGQKYLAMLMNDPVAGGNLMYTLAGYNGGPGNLKKWKAKVDYDGDPLLFIEALPSRETRNYVETVFANLWIYRHRFGQRAPTLHALLAGQWPVYISQDDGTGILQTAKITK